MLGVAVVGLGSIVAIGELLAPTIARVLSSGAETIEVRKDAHDDYAERYQREIGQLVWSHPSIKHSHYKNPQGKVFTLSPWPIETYWEWTRAVDPEDYVIA